MNRRVFAFTLQFVVATALLAMAWQFYLKTRYPAVFDLFAGPLLTAAGARDWRPDLLVGHFATWIPFTGLVIASRWLTEGWLSIVYRWLLGIMLIVAGHVLLTIGVYYFGVWCESLRTFYLALVPMYLANDCLPILLWLFLFRKEVVRRHDERFRASVA